MILHEKLKSYRLILASQSPRRRQLLSEAGIEYELAPRFECDEVYPSSLEASKVAEYLSQLKNKAYPATLGEKDILLTADTIVVADNKILRKPADKADAFAMLSMLSGREHEVITGVTLRSAKQQKSFSAHSKVRFRNLTDEEINYYIEQYKPMDKAGSYGIQEWIGYVGIEGIEGSFFNVMGLPIQRVWCELDKFTE